MQPLIAAFIPKRHHPDTCDGWWACLSRDDQTAIIVAGFVVLAMIVCAVIIARSNTKKDPRP
jgi:hypothetical protein